MQKSPDSNPDEKSAPASPHNLPGGKLNPAAFRKSHASEKKNIEELANSLKAGDTVALSKAITLIESNREPDRLAARQLINLCLGSSEHSVRIGISGSPGAGKSTFIEALGSFVADLGHKVAVLAVDPSSSVTGGSILGDKTRMEKLSAHPNAFIRPTPAGRTLGGVARHTRETVILCEAAGYDVIFIETVGVGQSETIAESMVDLFALLLLPGAGDELQGIKRGVVEMADLLIVNKADGDRIQQASQAKIAYQRALHLFPAKESGHTVEVFICSSTEAKGISTIWEHITKMLTANKASNWFTNRRQKQLLQWFDETILNNIFDTFHQNPSVQKQLESQKQAILEHKLSPFDAADILMKYFIEQLRDAK